MVEGEEVWVEKMKGRLVGVKGEAVTLNTKYSNEPRVQLQVFHQEKKVTKNIHTHNKLFCGNSGSCAIAQFTKLGARLAPH